MKTLQLIDFLGGLRKEHLKNFFFHKILLSTWFTAALFCCTVLSGFGQSISVGAIRFDAWYTPSKYPSGIWTKPGYPSNTPWEWNLFPNQWHYRLPFYGQEISPNEVKVRSDDQATMDQEIAYADAAGLDYWAFCYYGVSNSDPIKFHDPVKYAGLKNGLTLFRSSTNKKSMKYCLILVNPAPTSLTQWQTDLNNMETYLTDPAYMKVLGNRPLIYIFPLQDMRNSLGSTATTQQAISMLRQRSIDIGAGNPYIVTMSGDANAAKKDVNELSVDAISSYTSQGSGGDTNGLPFSDLAARNASQWTNQKNTGKKVIPNLNTGWDNRPRYTNTNWWHQATPAEVGANVQSAVAWINANPAVAEAKTIIIYAWNETDEGGWLHPTLSEGTARLDAIAQVLKPTFLWNFNTNGNLEGWQAAQQVTASVTGGNLNLTIQGSDPQIKSPDNLNALTTVFKALKVRLKNNTTATTARVFFTTTMDPSFSESKAKSFTLTANATTYSDYVIDLSTLSTWTGTIKQFRIDPVNQGGISSGTSNIDYVQLTTCASCRTAANADKEDYRVFQAYPVPARDQLTVRLQAKVAQAVTLHVYDFAGRELKAYTHQVGAGTNEFTLSTTTMQGGYYILSVIVDNRSLAQKVQIER